MRSEIEHDARHLCRRKLVVKITQKLISVGIILICTNACVSGKKVNDPFPHIPLIIYPGANSVKTYMSKVTHDKGVTYEVFAPFPPTELINFYFSKMEALGFAPYKLDGQGIGEWQRFDFRSGVWVQSTSEPERYIASWADKKERHRVFLALRYEHDGKAGKIGNTLIVSFTICNFFTMQEVEKEPGGRKSERGMGVIR